MLKVVSNTTPIISLLKLNKLDLLKKLYNEVTIPFAVYEEIEKGAIKSYYQNLKEFSWINITKIRNKESLDYFFELDKGEAEVLILAHEINADLVIIDELAGRRYAENLNLKLTGTLGILLKAKQNEIISSVKDELIVLQEKGTWLNRRLIDKVLKLANED